MLIVATGVSKTLWRGNVQFGTSHQGFHPIWRNGSSDNRLYFGDNLAVLQELSVEPSVRGRIRLIYIDPPYATNTVFQTRDLQDAYVDLLTGDTYLTFMRDRLILLRDVLADDGSIYVHLDGKMVFHVKVLMDQIFGASCFRNMITRKKCKTKNYTRNSYGNVSDYILFYSKTARPVWNRQYEPWSDAKILSEYPFVEENTGRRFKRVPVHAPGIRNGATGQPWRGIMPPKGKHWQLTPDKLEELDKCGEIHWSRTGNPRRKVYLDTSKGIPVQDIWLDFLDIDNQNTLATGYPTEKNIDMLKRIILASSNEGDWVLDCFAGSGSTLAAADELDRRWIGVDISNQSIKIILDRFQNGLCSLRASSQTDNDLDDNELPLFPKETPVPQTRNIRSQHVISAFSIWANGNYHGVEFALPSLGGGSLSGV